MVGARDDRGTALAATASTTDAGFTLAEVVVALSMIMVVLVSAGSFLTKSITSFAGQQKRQTAAALAAQALDVTRGTRPVMLVRGRTATGEAALRTSTLVDTTIDDTSSVLATAILNGPAGTVVVPYTATKTLGNVAYTVKTFIEVCWLPSGAPGTSRDCGASRSTGATSMFRVHVEVVWPRRGETCTGPTSTTCGYVVSTLRDATDRRASYSEPLFPGNLSTPTLTSLANPDATTRAARGTVSASSTATLTLTGTGFVTGASASATGWNQVVSTTVTSSTSISVTVNTAYTSGTYAVSVINPDGGTSGSVPLVVS